MPLALPRRVAPTITPLPLCSRPLDTGLYLWGLDRRSNVPWAMPMAVPCPSPCAEFAVVEPKGKASTKLRTPRFCS